MSQDQADLAKKKDDLAKLEQERGGEERAGEMAEEEVRRLRAKIEALARGMTTDEQGNAVTLDAQLTGGENGEIPLIARVQPRGRPSRRTRRI